MSKRSSVSENTRKGTIKRASKKAGRDTERGLMLSPLAPEDAMRAFLETDPKKLNKKKKRG